jgi:hypothetical protein
MPIAFLLLVVVPAGVLGWLLGVHIAFIDKQKKINQALADYVAADLQKTWEPSAQKLVKAIMGRDIPEKPK